MQPIHNIAILGSGALGGYYAARFQAVADFSVRVIARGERAATLRRDGLVINGTPLQLTVSDPDLPQEPADLIIVALKHHQLAEALPDLRHLVGEQTLIISVLNGLDSEEIIAAEYGWDKVLYCMVLGIDGVRRGNDIMVANAGRLFIGEATNPHASPRLQRLQAALELAGLPWVTPPDMIRNLWWKFMINVGINQASAVLRAPYAVFQQSSEARAVMANLMEEVITLAKTEQVDLTDQDLADWNKVLHSLSPTGKTSMLQDVEEGRKTEVEIFAGKVVDLGKKHAIQTPANSMMLHLLRSLEEMARLGFSA